MMEIHNPEELAEQEADLHAERRVLAACIFCREDVQDFLFGWLDPQDFHDPLHGQLLVRFRDKWEQGLLSNCQHFGRWLWEFCKEAYTGFLQQTGTDTEAFRGWAVMFLDKMIYGDCMDDVAHDACVLRMTHQEDAAVLRRLRLRRAEGHILIASYAKVHNAGRYPGEFARRVGKLMDWLDQLETSSGTLLRHLPPGLK